MDNEQLKIMRRVSRERDLTQRAQFGTPRAKSWDKRPNKRQDRQAV